MGVEKLVCVIVECDHCCDMLDHNDYTIFPDEQVGLSSAKEMDWVQSEDGDLYCDQCATVMPDGKIVSDASRKDMHEMPEPVKKRIEEALQMPSQPEQVPEKLITWEDKQNMAQLADDRTPKGKALFMQFVKTAVSSFDMQAWDIFVNVIDLTATDWEDYRDTWEEVYRMIRLTFSDVDKRDYEARFLIRLLALTDYLEQDMKMGPEQRT